MHPSVRIIALLIFAIVVYGLHGIALHFVFLTTLTGLLSFDLVKLGTARITNSRTSNPGSSGSSFIGLNEFLKLLKRVRYILLFLMLVYAFNTPGEYLSNWHFSMAPTYEGINAALEQALRLSMILAGLAFLLITTNRNQMIAGLYSLAQPFRLLGLDPVRFAVRLWLTLYYVEHGSKSRHQNSIQQLMHLEELIEIDSSAPEQIVLMKPVLRWQDILALTGLILLGAYMLCA